MEVTSIREPNSEKDAMKDSYVEWKHKQMSKGKEENKFEIVKQNLAYFRVFFFRQEICNCYRICSEMYIKKHFIYFVTNWQLDENGTRNRLRS